jgi:type VI protein secretion system component Hcp
MLRQVFVGNRANAVITVTRPVQTGQTAAEKLTLTLTASAVTQDTESHTTAGATENVALYFNRVTVAYTSATGVTTQWYYDRTSNTVG